MFKMSVQVAKFITTLYNYYGVQEVDDALHEELEPFNRSGKLFYSVFFSFTRYRCGQFCSAIK